ncbi:hypothetical protein WJX82_009623 [Trebouxia sp. C0006]
MLKLHGLSLLLQLALTAPALASLTSVNESSAEPLRIAFAPHPFLSHWAVSAPIAHELLQRGHKALFVASTEDWCSLRATGLAHHPNVSVATYQAPYSESRLRETINGYRGSPLHAVLETFFNIRDFSDAMLTDRRLFCQVQAFDADLLVADPGNLGGWALADALDIHKAIVQVPGFTPPLDADLYGHGGHSPAFVPTFGSVLPTRMTLTQRCQNVGTWALVMVIWRGFINWFASYHIWWKHNIAPHSYRESGRRSCLVLVNSHFALAPPRPLGPKVHVVGPLTAKSPEPLPADLEAFMQSAGQFGVVYASLGYTAIPERHELQAVADALAAVAPVSVLWKLTAADQQLLGVGNVTLSHNIRLIEWAPQNDVLGHPATRAFLTQAGTNSFNEAAYHGVPIVGLPLFAEQPDNMARATEQGFGLSVSVDDALGLAQNLRRALLQILQNPSFAENANRVSRRIRATHWSPASQAASLIEHAAWTQGDAYLDTPLKNMPWYQQILLDVLAVCSAVTAVLAVASLWMYRWCSRHFGKHVKVA